jgi:hypothetical protein
VVFQPGGCHQHLLRGRLIHELLSQTRMRMNTGIVIRAIAATGLIVIGLLIVLVSVTALDPVGAKHADDADPFGPPPSRLETAVILLLGGGVLVFAVLLIRLGRPASTRRLTAASSGRRAVRRARR